MKNKGISFILVIALLLVSILAPNKAFAGEENANAVGDETIGQSMIDEGYLELNQDGTTSLTSEYIDYANQYAIENNLEVIFTDNSITYVDRNEDSNMLRAAKKNTGVTKVVWNGLYAKIYLNNAACKKIQKYGFFGTLSGLFIKALAAPLSIVLTMNIGLISVKNKGRGVIYYVSTPPLVINVLWLKSQ